MAIETFIFVSFDHSPSKNESVGWITLIHTQKKFFFVIFNLLTPNFVVAQYCLQPYLANKIKVTWHLWSELLLYCTVNDDTTQGVLELVATTFYEKLFSDLIIMQL